MLTTEEFLFNQFTTPVGISRDFVTILSGLMYGTEIWMWTKGVVRTLHAGDMKFLQSITIWKKKYTDKKNDKFERRNITW